MKALQKPVEIQIKKSRLSSILWIGQGFLGRQLTLKIGKD